MGSPDVGEEIDMGDGKIGLSVRKLKELMTQCIESFEKGETPIELYTDTYFEWTKLFKHLGPAIAIAFKGKCV